MDNFENNNQALDFEPVYTTRAKLRRKKEELQVYLNAWTSNNEDQLQEKLWTEAYSFGQEVQA